MIDVAANLAAVRARIAAACRACGRAPEHVDLLAVSKRHPADLVRAAVAAGQRAFGENRVQELAQKAAELDDEPLCWHLIGSLQTNKVKDVVRVPGLALVHSLDRERLADELHRHLERDGRTLDVLLQVNASGEQQKHGVAPEHTQQLLEHVATHAPTLRVVGLMAMGPLEGDPRPVFDAVAALHERLRARSGLALPTLSLGMSGDLEAAVAAGSTLVRVGSAVFGPRD